ncbi:MULTISPECIES: HNH endonuclease [Halomonadaceae]|uniref:HNH nuclease domain-containing protein n=1 Tax=Vreelandella halophila TaxID=86177 RepID=A0A9X4YB63_9GAMM|nr:MULTISPECIES: HNH endonuclease [Halomonas]MYL26507.1 hypothetical protein [Halomonas utahensis]MYL73844.1 hypothetical protein [Halomonas sp. 22501_18_FS]
MSLSEILNELPNVNDWDNPLFKRLPRNDTGQARGHQAGFLLPTDLRQYFPELPLGQNTAGVRIQADLYLGLVFLKRVNSRYQYQTWGATRNPETRVTDNLRPLLNEAVAGDFLLIRRHLDQPERYCFQLIRRNDSGYAELQSRVNNRRSGVLGEQVLSTNGIENEESTLWAQTQEEFLGFADRNHRNSNARKPVRRAAFSRLVLSEYGYRCCVCGSGLSVPEGPAAAQAAHIIPVAAGGTDDPRNGLALCPNHHWAFDNGLFTVTPEMQIQVSEAASALPVNNELKELSGQFVRRPENERFMPHETALEWHASHVFE